MALLFSRKTIMTKKNVNENGDKTFKYSEIFHSFQGEGFYTGRSTAWIRFFLCNLSCDGFGQKDPTDPSTYVLPYETFDVSKIQMIEDLPVWEYGCDSSYTWAKKYRHLAHDDSAFEICNKIQEHLAHPSNPQGLFIHPHTKQHHHMAFTGGEPMLSQEAMVAILEEFNARDNLPHFVTVETNGTKPFKKNVHLDAYISNSYVAHANREWFWSVSPKLWSTAGEKAKKAIQPEVVASYAEVSNFGQLKYVVNGSQQSWDEVEQHTEAFRKAGVDFPVYIMAVGATKEEQEASTIPDIAMEAIRRGYHFSGRLHCYVFGNKIGT